MFDITKFGGYLSRLRKNADMTQSELADRLNVTHQAISRYEKGHCFPDIAVLVLLADIFHVTLDELIGAGEPTKREFEILGKVATGSNEIAVDDLSEIAGIAPILKPGVLNKLTDNCQKQGIDITSIVDLAEYLSDETILSLIERADFDIINDELLTKLLPLLDVKTKSAVFEKILDGTLDWHLLETLLPYAEFLTSQIEAAVIEGALPDEALDILYRHFWDQNGYRNGR